MANTSTFSAIIDDVIARSLRRDRIADIVAYARSTIRECQVLAFFEQDMIEAELTVNVLPFQWTRPVRLRTLLAAKPNEVFTRRDKDIWFKNRPPGQKVNHEDYYLYLSGNTYIFSGRSLELGSTIGLAYFNYSRKFVYYDEADRPAVFDDETETWSYLAQYDVDDASRELARDLVTDWLVFYWYQLILEGTLAKLYKTTGDERSKASFALYKQQQNDLLSGERIVYINDRHDVNG